MKILFYIILIFLLIPKLCFALSVDGVIIDGISLTTDNIVITSPVQYQTFQRSGTTGTIVITGTYSGMPTDIEASFNGGSYAVIDSSPSGGTFSGSLTSQTQGQGTLIVRFANDTSVSSSKTFVGIGEVFLIAGQSNASGRGLSNQSYSSVDGFKAVNFKNNYTWSELSDPYDSSSGQVDTVSSDSLASGSWVLPLATLIMNSQHVPVAFIPSSLAGSGIDIWQPGVDHQDRATLYGSSVYRALQATGGIRAVLWWQGEYEAASGKTQAYYYNYFVTLASAYLSDLGVKIMPCKLQNSTAIDDGDEALILAAIGQAWLNTSTTLTGPDFSDLSSDDDYHFTSNGNLSTAASRWFTAIETAFGW